MAVLRTFLAWRMTTSLIGVAPVVDEPGPATERPATVESEPVGQRPPTADAERSADVPPEAPGVTTPPHAPPDDAPPDDAPPDDALPDDAPPDPPEEMSVVSASDVALDPAAVEDRPAVVTRPPVSAQPVDRWSSDERWLLGGTITTLTLAAGLAVPTILGAVRIHRLSGRIDDFEDDLRDDPSDPDDVASQLDDARTDRSRWRTVTWATGTTGAAFLVTGFVLAGLTALRSKGPKVVPSIGDGQLGLVLTHRF